MNKYRWMFFSIVILWHGSSSLSAEPIAVIVSKETPVSEVSKKELKKVFLGKRKKFSDGTKIKTFEHSSESDLKEKFHKSLTGKTLSNLQVYWARRVFSGKGVPPEKANDDQEMISKVASTKGAIGYVSKSAVTDQVKVVFEIM